MSKILGIDLGTSTSEVAVLEDKKPKLISNKFKEKVTPSVVGISEDGDIIVGKDAKDQFLLKPKDTVLEVKRLMGSKETVQMGDNKYKPEEISSYILKYLKSVGDYYLDDDVKRAVITVPAYFTDEQRKATVKAGKLAGFEVERIINEPTAAALAYGIDNMEDESHILVYDLGGGTLDVTVLEMFDGVIDVKSSSGNNELGGKDFDKVLMDDIVSTFQKENDFSLEKNIYVLSKLKKSSEECKIALSQNLEHTIEIPFIAEVDGKPIALKRNITREYFEDLIYDLVKSSLLPVKRALRDAKVKKEDIDKVLLVGGSTRIPLVRKLLNETLKKDIVSIVNPDYAVAMGAAIQGGIINDEFSTKEDIIITDVCPYSLGLETLGFVDGLPMPDILDILIPRNTSIPAVKEKIYTTAVDFQEKVEIKVYQGDKKRASHNNFLGTFMLTDIPKAPSGEEKIKVKFMYDINGLLQVDATILSNNKKASITIEASGIEDKNSVDIDKWSESKKARRYKRLINKAEDILKNIDEVFIKYEIEDVLRELKTALVLEKETETIKEISERLSDIIYELEEE